MSKSGEKPIFRAYHQAREDITAQRLSWQSQLQNHRMEKDKLTGEWQQWKNLKEPEPPRSAARENTRSKRAADSGAPLCEFRPGLSEEEKAALESTLQQSGLLDAWVTPSGIGVLGPEEEEIWLEPAPQIMRATLVDYLMPTPPENSGITAEMIDNVLRTVCLGLDASEPGEAVITGQGYFRLGALQGKAPLKARAEFIGRETRHRTRLAEIARLELLIEEEDKNIQACGEQLALLDAAAVRLEEDICCLSVLPTPSARCCCPCDYWNSPLGGQTGITG